jgi:hypothetical protein
LCIGQSGTLLLASRKLDEPLVSLDQYSGSVNIVDVTVELSVGATSLFENVAKLTSLAKQWQLSMTKDSVGSFSDKQIAAVTDSNSVAMLELMNQSILQTLVHVTRKEENRQRFFRLQGVKKLLGLQSTLQSGVESLQNPSAFNLKNMCFTVIQHQIEEPQYLQTIMETTIKLCMTRLLARNEKQTGSKNAPKDEDKAKEQTVPFKSLVDVVCPLIFRSPSVFMKSFTSVCGLRHKQPASVSVTSSAENCLVFLKTSTVSEALGPPGLSQSGSSAEKGVADSAQNSAQDGHLSKRRRGSSSEDVKGGTEAVVPLDAPEEPQAEKRRRTGCATVDICQSSGHIMPGTPAHKDVLAPPPVHVTPRMKSSSKSHTPHKLPLALETHMQSTTIPIVDELISDLIDKWCLVRYAASIDGPIPAEKLAILDAYARTLNISNLLISLADLMSTVPSVAVYVNKKTLSGYTANIFEEKKLFFVDHSILIDKRVPNPTFASLVVHEFSSKWFVPPAVYLPNHSSEKSREVCSQLSRVLPYFT